MPMLSLKVDGLGDGHAVGRVRVPIVLEPAMSFRGIVPGRRQRPDLEIRSLGSGGSVPGRGHQPFVQARGVVIAAEVGELERDLTEPVGAVDDHLDALAWAMSQIRRTGAIWPVQCVHVADQDELGRGVTCSATSYRTGPAARGGAGSWAVLSTIPSRFTRCFSEPTSLGNPGWS